MNSHNINQRTSPGIEPPSYTATVATGQQNNQNPPLLIPVGISSMDSNTSTHRIDIRNKANEALKSLFLCSAGCQIGCCEGLAGAHNFYTYPPHRNSVFQAPNTARYIGYANEGSGSVNMGRSLGTALGCATGFTLCCSCVTCSMICNACQIACEEIS